MGNKVESTVEKVVKLLSELQEKQRAEKHLTKLEIYALREASSWLFPEANPSSVTLIGFDLSKQNF